jgi:hypothetical protein
MAGAGLIDFVAGAPSEHEEADLFFHLIDGLKEEAGPFAEPRGYANRFDAIAADTPWRPLLPAAPVRCSVRAWSCWPTCPAWTPG